MAPSDTDFGLTAIPSKAAMRARSTSPAGIVSRNLIAGGQSLLPAITFRFSLDLMVATASAILLGRWYCNVPVTVRPACEIRLTALICLSVLAEQRGSPTQCPRNPCSGINSQPAPRGYHVRWPADAW